MVGDGDGPDDQGEGMANTPNRTALATDSTLAAGNRGWLTGR